MNIEQAPLAKQAKAADPFESLLTSGFSSLNQSDCRYYEQSTNVEYFLVLKIVLTKLFLCTPCETFLIWNCKKSLKLLITKH